MNFGVTGRVKHIARIGVSIGLCIVLQWGLGKMAFADSELMKSEEAGIKDALVKIYTSYVVPDYYNPWNMRGISKGSGSGCIISGNRILTNAHVIADSTFIQVQRYGQAKLYEAEVLNVSHDADLALLTVKDTSFFKGIIPLELGELPEPQEEVFVYGFPVGGDSLSITKGVLSRIEHRFYTHSSQYLLAGQIDAAINYGNSGGPVLVDGKIAGVVMQMLRSKMTDNIGYMVPVTVVKHFFDDIEDGRYDGFPEIGIIIQNLENPDMKRKYGLKDEQTGILINTVLPSSPAQGLLQKGDILLAIDGHPIADNGTVEFRPKERSSYTYYSNIHQLGESITLEVFKHGDVRQFRFPLTRTKHAYSLVPDEQYDVLPSYFIYGGIVFTPLTKNLIKQLGGSNWWDDAPAQLVAELSKWVTKDRLNVVVALKVLASDLNQGYHNVFAWVVDEVNGQKIKDFEQCFQIITQATEPYIVLKNRKGFEIVIDRKKAETTHKKILWLYRIKEDRSSDLKELK